MLGVQQQRNGYPFFIEDVVYTRECLPTMKKNEVMPFAGKWMQPEVIIGSELIHPKKKIMFYIFCDSQIFIHTHTQNCVCLGHKRNQTVQREEED